MSTAMTNEVLMQIVSVRSVGAEEPSEAQWGRDNERERERVRGRERERETARTTREA